MACYRLTFQHGQVFEIVIDEDEIEERGRTLLHTAVIHRVTRGAREFSPLQSARGGPIRIVAITEEAALMTAAEVLKEVTGTPVFTRGECGLKSSTRVSDAD